MWAIEAKAKINIPLGESVADWTNAQLRKFIKSKRTGGCSEFDKALKWLGKMTYAKAKRNCDNTQWLSWLESNIPKEDNHLIKAGETITVSKGKTERYALWYNGIWDLPEEYVGETIRVISTY